MKKLLFVSLFGLVISASTLASENIPMRIINNGSTSQGPTYAPPRPWYIQQDDYTLTLPAFEDDYVLELRDQDDEVVYTTFLPSGSTQVILPSTLSGSFEIRLVADTYYYRGYLSI